MDEVGPNDPNRGRSSIGGFKLPGSKPIPVRDIEDVRDAGWGGMRKPKPNDDPSRDTNRTDLSGGGYTASQTNNERGKLFLIFLGGPIAFLAVVGFLGWLTSRPVEPLTSVCTSAGYEATYLRSDFHEDARLITIDVSFNGEDYWRNGDTIAVQLPNDPSAELEVIARPTAGTKVTTCKVERIKIE